MAKRNRTLQSDKRISEGKGFGQGEEYKPWITIQDFPSSGRVSRIRGIKTKRQHEFLSDLERDYFYLLDFSDKVIDIREQFPLLPIEETLLIANELGIEHPAHPKTKEPIVMTTDFLVTVQGPLGKEYEVARTIKSKDKLLEERVLQKFEIERIYFKTRDIDWGIVTEQEINKEVANNLADLYSYQNLAEVNGFMDMDAEDINDIVQAFISRGIDYKGSMRSMCTSFDKDMELNKGSGIAVLKHLVVNKLIIVNIIRKLDLNEHIDIKIKDKKSIEGAEIG